MKEFAGVSIVAMITLSSLWIAQHETPRQEMLMAIALIVVSAIVIAISLKTMSSES